MPERITSQQFHESSGVTDWRSVSGAAIAVFRTKSFATGVRLVTAIGELADAVNHHPDVDLRYGSVTVRVMTHDIDALSQKDVDLARKISSAAARLGILAQPAAVQSVQLTIDALEIDKVKPFWRAVLNYREKGDADLVDPTGRGPSIWFQQMDAPRPQRGRIHVDVSVPHDQAEARIAAALEAGGHLVTDKFAPAWWTLADAEGNEADVTTWMRRE